jgi:hypothetical protein
LPRQFGCLPLGTSPTGEPLGGLLLFALVGLMAGYSLEAAWRGKEGAWRALWPPLGRPRTGRWRALYDRRAALRSAAGGDAQVRPHRPLAPRSLAKV